MPPSPSANFKSSMNIFVTQSVRIFVYKNVTETVLLFAKCLDFCIWKRLAIFFDFCIYKMGTLSLADGSHCNYYDI